MGFAREGNIMQLSDNIGYPDKKTQTTKDLAKTWAQIPSLIPNSQPLSTPRQSEHENPSFGVDADRVGHFSLPHQQHSALTTILMDDSPLNTVL